MIVLDNLWVSEMIDNLFVSIFLIEENNFTDLFRIIFVLKIFKEKDLIFKLDILDIVIKD